MTSITSIDAAAESGTKESFWTRIIASDIADAIGRGAYRPGQRLPSEHALAEQFGVNRHTPSAVRWRAYPAKGWCVSHRAAAPTSKTSRST